MSRTGWTNPLAASWRRPVVGEIHLGQLVTIVDARDELQTMKSVDRTYLRDQS